jgi:eukaryotic-like serine/threonine-protein kinase
MEINQKINGFTLTQWIGSGGMGQVYKAKNETTGQVAAIKILNRKEQAGRFKNEAYIQSSVKHPSIAAVFDYQIESGNPCIIMEYVEGITLDKIIKTQGKLPEPFVNKVMKQMASAVAYLHEKKIIHRDLKPANLKVNQHQIAKLLDFGIAKASYTPRLTQEGYIVGTAHYMAPEQFKNQDSVQSDCWALGVMMYQMLTGQLPFEGRTDTEVRRKIEQGNYTEPNLLSPEIKPRMRTIIKQLLRVNPENRMTSKNLLMYLEKPHLEVSEGIFTKIKGLFGKF